MKKKKLSELNTDENLLQSWKRDIFDKADDVDPENEYIWDGVAIGYFIGKGQSIESAYRLMRLISNKGWI